jgi:hypothetical protein
MTLTRSNFVLQITQGLNTATVNGKVRTLSVPPTIIKGTFYVPLKFVANELGYVMMVNGRNV